MVVNDHGFDLRTERWINVEWMNVILELSYQTITLECKVIMPIATAIFVYKFW